MGIIGLQSQLIVLISKSCFLRHLDTCGENILKNQREQEQAKAHNKAAIAQTKYSALTGAGPGQLTQAPSAFEGALQGAASGAMIGQMGQKAGWWGQGSKAAPQVISGINANDVNPAGQGFMPQNDAFKMPDTPWQQQQDYINRIS